MKKTKKGPGSTPEPTDGRTITTGQRNHITGTELAQRGEKLRDEHFKKHPRSRCDIYTDQLEDLLKEWEREGDPVEALMKASAAGFFKGYQAHQLEERTRHDHEKRQERRKIREEWEAEEKALQEILDRYPETIPAEIRNQLEGRRAREYVSVGVTYDTLQAYLRDESGEAEGILLNDSTTLYGLDAGTLVPLKLRGTDPAIIPGEWLQEYATAAMKYESNSRTARRRQPHERKDKADYIRHHMAED